MRAIEIFRVLLLFVVVASTTCQANSSFKGDPYKILGLASDASQDEIRSSYRKLCLRYHPDKNVGKGQREKSKCTEMFKKIQAANSLIGDADSRRSYDTRSSLFSHGSRRPGFSQYQFRDDNVDAFYRAFAGFADGGSRRRSSSSDQFFGFSARDVFPKHFGKTSMFWNGGSLKSKFVQKIKIPLPDLYKGHNSMEFQVQDSVWKSYCAAFRGGFGYLILYQSAIFAAPLLRFSKWASLAFSALVFHMHVPRPQVFQYTADILPGFKEGTKLTFRDAEEGFDVVFVVEEEPHEQFTREGNNLHTTVDILASQAKEGCTIELESLNPADEAVIQVRLRPRQIQQSGDTVTVKQKGWPQRKTGGRGDLIIRFRIVRKLSTKRKGFSRKKGRDKKRRKKKPQL